MMTRYGYEEECYFGFKWSPFIGRDGNLTGVYASCWDTTENTIASRRRAWLREINTEVAKVHDFDSLWTTLSKRIEEDPLDLPNVMMYSNLRNGACSNSSSILSLATCIGVKARHYAAPLEIDLRGPSTYALAMRQAREDRSIVVLRKESGEIHSNILSELEPRSFNGRSVEIAICPIFSGDEVVCYFVAALSSKKRYGPRYDYFLKTLTEDVIGARLGAILLAYEQEKGRRLAKNAEEQRSRALSDLEQSELKYKKFADHAPLGLVRLNTKGDLLYCNPAWRTIMGFQDGDTDERPWLKKMHPDSVQASDDFFEKIRDSREPLSTEHRLLRTYHGLTSDDDEHPFWVLVTGFREDDDHVICWVTDISAQKAATMALHDKMEDAILQRTRQENFIDMISHEIRNPLSAVLHCSEDIIRSTKDHLETCTSSSSGLKGSLESAQTIVYCVEHQKRIVDDVLTLSKLDADLLDITHVPVEPRKAIRTALAMFDRELAQSNIKLSIIEEDSLDALEVKLLMLDPNRFLQVLINLVTNSIKFTRSAPRKEITILISADRKRPTPPDTHFFPTIRPADAPVATPPATPNNETLYLAVSVCDTGKGLSKEETQKLFNRFSQASPKTHIQYGGSGLGLFISRQIVELMNGEIGIRHEQEAGCTFAFFVQTQRASASPTEELLKAAGNLTISLNHHPITPSPGSATSSHYDTPLIRSPLELPNSSLKVEFSGIFNIANDTMNSQQTPAKPSLPPLKEPHAPRAKILVVEDNLINQRVVCKQLKNRGYAVHAANHGGEALEHLHAASEDASGKGKGYFDIVLCDIEMPVMDGVACVKEVRRLERQGLLRGHIPVVAVTANARSVHVQRALEAGMVSTHSFLFFSDEVAALWGRCADVLFRMTLLQSRSGWTSWLRRSSALCRKRKKVSWMLVDKKSTRQLTASSGKTCRH